MSDSDAPSRLLTRFASRMAQALGLAPKTTQELNPAGGYYLRPDGGVGYEFRGHADGCHGNFAGCFLGCETDDELRGRIQRIVRELDE